jgi:hypothetical protein
MFAIQARGQVIERRDTLPPAIKTDVRGRQKSVSERIVLPKDFSMLASPVGGGDIVKLVQTLPGVAIGSDGSSNYYVRGGNMGGNLQTLDGVPVYGSAHLIGLTTAYPSDVIGSSEFLVGGFTSEEGNLSASHIKLHSLDGSFDTASAKLDLSNLLLGAVISAPLVEDRVSLITSFRASPAQYEYRAVSKYLDQETVGIQDAQAAIYDFYAKIKYRMDGRRALSLTAFRSQDRYNFLMKSGSEDKMSWGNLIAILQYDTRWRGKDDMTLTASFNRYGNAQGMFKQMDKTSNNLQIRSLINEGQLHAIVRSSAWNNWRYQYGLKARLAHFKPGSARILETTGLFPKTSSPMSTQTWMNVTGTAHGQVEYGNYDRNLFRLAGRLNYNNLSGFAPEASVLARLSVFDHLGLEATGDYLTQFYHTLEGTPLGWSLDMLVPPTESLKPEHTAQVYAGLYSDVADHHFSAGAYYKKSFNLVYFSDASKLFDSSRAGWEEHIEVGSGTSRGLEFLYEKSSEIASWRLAYTWSKTDRLFPNLNKGQVFPAKYDRTHILNATASLRVVSHKRLDISLGSLFTYQSGHMETVIAGSYWDENFILPDRVEQDFYTTINNYRMPPYIRCDFSVMFEFLHPKHPQTLNIGVYNLLNRHNPFCLSYDPETNGWLQISLIPILPCLKYSVTF